jgi:hypothetical protein
MHKRAFSIIKSAIEGKFGEEIKKIAKENYKKRFEEKLTYRNFQFTHDNH